MAAGTRRIRRWEQREAFHHERTQSYAER
jgi:hypothetical protein